MTKPKIDVFSEGATEKNILAQLAKRGIINGEFEERGGGGEKMMMANLRLRLREWIELPSDQQNPFSILLLRDLDKHEGKTEKTIDDVCKSTIGVISPHDQNAQLLPHPTHENVFELQSTLTGLRLGLHIANQCYLDTFVKATIDDYVLKLALLETTAQALLQHKKEAGERQNPKRDWQLEAAALQKKLLEEIPQLLSQNKIPALMEAKEYVRFYSTLLQEHSSPATFAGKILAHADERDIRDVFAPLLAAIQRLTSEG